MKFQPDTLAGVNAISRMEPDRLWVGTTPHHASVLVPWRGEVLPWPAERFESLSREHFDKIAALEPEVVIFGSGARLRFAHPVLLAGLMERRVGVECMDNGAAARTYNVLVNEGRRVVGAFLFEGIAQARS